MTTERPRLFGFALFAWTYTVAVILFGAWVRISGSGDGCGQNWPTCHGAVVPPTERIETIIEYTHRATSGLSLVLVVILVIGAFRTFDSPHVARKGAIASLGFILFEAALGAGLVLFGLVGENDSMFRAAVMALHLVSTLALTGAITVTAWASASRSAPRFGGPGGRRMWLLAGLGLLVIVSIAGAVTALGDTLYPSSVEATAGIAERIASDQVEGVPFFVRLRVIHPFIAVVATGMWLAIYAICNVDASAGARRWGHTLAVLLSTQLIVGVLNIALHAPGWMQIVHLLFAVSAWTVAVLYTLELERAGDDTPIAPYAPA